MRSFWWTKLAGSVGFRIALKPLSECVNAVALDLSDLTDLGGWPSSNDRVCGALWGGAMAVLIRGGLAVATVLVLFAVPWLFHVLLK